MKPAIPVKPAIKPANERFKTKGKHHDIIPSTELKGIDMLESKFIEACIFNLYERILWLVVNDVDADESLRGNIKRSCADNYTMKGQRGLIHYIAKAMTQRKQIVLEKEEVEHIPNLKHWLFNADFYSGGWTGDDRLDTTKLYLDFSKFNEPLMLGLYYLMLFNALDGADKGIKVSQALLLKIAELNRITNEERNTEDLKAQLTEFDAAIRDGRLAYIDGDSSAEFVTFDTAPTESAVSFLYNAIANVTGFPTSFITGQDTGSSLSDTGERERKQIRRAKQRYFLSVVEPVLEELYRKEFQLVIDIENTEQLQMMTDLLGVELKHNSKVRLMCNMFGFKAADFESEAETKARTEANIVSQFDSNFDEENPDNAE